MNLDVISNYERGYADAMNWKLQNHLEKEDDDIQDYNRGLG
jgi:hypothetical protein